MEVNKTALKLEVSPMDKSTKSISVTNLKERKNTTNTPTFTMFHIDFVGNAVNFLYSYKAEIANAEKNDIAVYHDYADIFKEILRPLDAPFSGWAFSQHQAKFLDRF